MRRTYTYLGHVVRAVQRPHGDKLGENHEYLRDDVIKWKHFPHYWPFVYGIHRSPVNSPHKGQWRGALMYSLICARINGWVNNREAIDLRRHRAHYDAIVMYVIKQKKPIYIFGLWTRLRPIGNYHPRRVYICLNLVYSQFVPMEGMCWVLVSPAGMR